MKGVSVRDTGMSRQGHVLQRRHFAFMRAVLQGLDERESWHRYLGGEGQAADARTVRQSIAEIRDAFAAAARRAVRPGLARLVRLDPAQFAGSDALPTLEDFAVAQGMEDFSAAEQAEAYAAAYPDATFGRRRGARPAQRHRLIQRQLDALRWLEDQAPPEPSAHDEVAAWLNAALAARLAAAGLGTLGELVVAIRRDGMNWWRPVRGVGALKARRLAEWLDAQDPARGLSPSARPALPEPATASPLLPLERLQVPAGLTGRDGVYRDARRAPGGMHDDRAAILAWLSAKTGLGEGSHPSPTWRRYRKEAERLWLWAVFERGVALSSLGSRDVADYLAFLRLPPAHWCGPRHHERASPQWRPLEGPLGTTSVLHARAVLCSLFSWLVAQGYLTTNPMLAIDAERPHVPATDRSDNPGDIWREFERYLEQGGSTMHGRVLRCVRWALCTGLSLEQLAALRLADLVPPSQTREPGHAGPEAGGAWRVRLPAAGGARGRGAPRHAVVPAALVHELAAALTPDIATDGHERQHQAQAWLLGPASARSAAAPWSAAAMAKAVQRAAAQCGLTSINSTPMGRGPAAGIRGLRRSVTALAMRSRKPESAPPQSVTPSGVASPPDAPLRTAWVR